MNTFPCIKALIIVDDILEYVQFIKRIFPDNHNFTISVSKNECILRNFCSQYTIVDYVTSSARGQSFDSIYILKKLSEDEKNIIDTIYKPMIRGYHEWRR